MDCGHGVLLLLVRDETTAVAYYSLLLQNGLQSWYFIVCCNKMDFSHGILLLVVTDAIAAFAYIKACCYKMDCSRGILLFVVTKWTSVMAFYLSLIHISEPTRLA